MLFADDLLKFSIGILGHIRPNDTRKGTLFTRDDDAVQYELNTCANPPYVTLAYGGTRNSVELTSQRTVPHNRPVSEATRHRRPSFWGNDESPPRGRKWFFVGSKGDRGSKLYWVPRVGFDTRRSIAMEYRVHHISVRKRRLLALEKNRKKMWQMMRSPTIQKFLTLQTHCDDNRK
jgi:hypothetical protein